METQKCIWMLAGSVEYQLCPLKQNCDQCDFHNKMLRGGRQGQAGEPVTMVIRNPEPSLIQFTAGLQFLHRHFWIKRTGEGKVRIGVDAFMWQILSSVQKIVSAKVNSHLVQNQCFTWFQLRDGIIYLRTPIPGKILQINPLFNAERILDTHLYLSPEEELWFVELELEESSNEVAFLSKDAYLEQVTEDIALFNDLRASSTDGTSPVIAQRSLMSKKEFSFYLQKTSDSLIYIC